ncbi:hypothetical protein IGI04_007015, partial [Brassica rapa subsp. trilocularis]
HTLFPAKKRRRSDRGIITNTLELLQCWDCDIPCPTLYSPISTILSTLGLRRLARMDLLLVSFLKGLTFLCLISDVRLNLLSHILPLKLRTTFISFHDLLTFLQHTFSFLFYPFLLKGYFSLLASLCQTALIPIVGIVKSHVQLYILRLVRYCPLWALGSWPAWIYFWFPSQKASYY